MLSYETLDAIADTCVPVLLLLSLVIVCKTAVQRNWRLCGNYLVTLFGFALVAYGIMFIDLRFQLWPALGLDYSTHTATSLALSVFLIMVAKEYWFIWLMYLVFYYGLMIYQEYHSIADIVMTVFACGLFIVPLAVTSYRFSSLSFKADVSKPPAFSVK